MTSLVNVIKSVNKTWDEAKVIQIQPMIQPCVFETSNSNIDNEGLLEVKKLEIEIIQKAREKAKELIEQANEEIQKKKEELIKEEESLHKKISDALEEARVKGYQEGFEAGRDDGLQSVENLIQEAKKIVDSSQKDYYEKLESAELEIIDLAVKIAEKIVGKKIENDSEYWIQLVKTALKEVREHEDIKIFVHPSKFELTKSQKKTLEAILHDSTDLYIYPEDELKEDACIIETSFGTVDASVDSQLTEIKKQLLQIVEEMQHE
jgi:flagellar assembly protein FliH